MRIPITLGGITRGNGNYNALSRRRERIAGFPGANYSETLYPMTKAEEDGIRSSFRNIPGMDPSTAETLADEAIAIDPHYRASDTMPKYGGSTPSSSFIQGVDVSPGLGLVTLTMKNGRSYSYPVTADQAAQLVNADSIGAWYNANMKLKRGGNGAATIGRQLSDPAAVGTSVGMTMDSIPQSAIKQMGKNLARSGKNPSTAINGARAALGGAAFGGAGVMLLAQILQAAKEADKDI